MSVDPAAAASAGSGAAALDALITAELNALAADAQALQSQVAVGDILNATVLPSNGLSDLLNIQGNRVAASLPPTVAPGDQLTVQVTGFNGPQILLQILSADGSAPTSTGTAPATAIPVPTGSGTAAATPFTGTASTATPEPTASAPGPIAPPAAVFVAGSVRPNAPVPPPIPPGASDSDVPVDANPGTIPGAAGTTLPAPSFDGIEARLVAARATSVSTSVTLPGSSGAAASALPGDAAAALAARLAPQPPPAAPSAAGPPPSATVPPPRPGAAAPAPAPAPAPTAGGGAPPPLAGRFVVPPQIVASRWAAPSAPAAPVANAAPTAAGAPVASAPAASGPAAASTPPAPTPASFQDPLALVRALKLPVTPTNLAAAKLALDAPQRLPAALATLERALPETDDPRVTTLRTIVAFVGKMEPASPQLATQIAAYVEHVVSGSEPALGALLAAHVEESAPAPPAAVAAPAGTPPADAAAGEPAAAAAAAAGDEAPAAAPPVTASAVPVLAQAQVVERSAAIAVSLKEQLFSLVGAPPASGREAEAIVPSAASALTAVTSVQLAAAQAAAANPQTLSFSLPMWMGGGYAQAQVAVDRDAPDTPNVPLDGDNFHIAFILETKHLGTVAIDLKTVGRAFSLAVQTETLRSAQRFGDELTRLTDRLTSLRYQPKSVEATVAPTPGQAEVSTVPLVVTDAPEAGPPAGFNERA